MKTAKNIAHTKSLISLALFMLVHKTPYDDISVKEICEKAGVSRMSFYRYYNKKDDIFIDFCDSRFEEFYDLYLKDNKNIDPRDFTLNMFRFFKKYSKSIEVLILAGKEHLLSVQFLSYAKFLIGRSKDVRIKNLEANKIIAPLFSGGFFAVLMTWISDGMEETPEEINNILYQVPELIGLK